MQSSENQICLAVVFSLSFRFLYAMHLIKDFQLICGLNVNRSC